ncbi:MAG: sugar ABC transporter permease [Anaerolineae bacterium]|nr:sugar ABC transporter permease [Anaerolineae bacterium]
MATSADVVQTESQATWLKPWLTRETGMAWLFILPSLIGFIVFYAVPAVRGLFISFTDWDLLTESQFVGLDNYARLVSDTAFWQSLGVTLGYVVINIAIQTVLAILIAVLMDRLAKSIVVRGVLILPYLLSNVVVGLLWLWMLDPTLGIINAFLTYIGIGRQPFLGSPDQAIASIAWINIWRHMGYTALLVFAGLQTIPKDVYEAASIDGASEWRTFWGITLPLLRPVLVFVLVITVIGSFQVFDTIAVTTQGGPANATRVIVWYIAEFAFDRFDMGYATTISVALFLILAVVTFIQMRVMRAGESDL